MAGRSSSRAVDDHWREYFRKANSDIFDIIEHAIVVAAADCPKEFRVRRDRIAELLFSSKLTRCTGCDSVELAVAPALEEEEEEEEDDEDVGFKSEYRDAGGSKESKANSCVDDQVELNANHASNFSYGEAEALTDEIEEQSQILAEVDRIKEILYNFEYESDSVLFESLRRLQLMALNVDVLRVTQIGKAVNCLRKHSSKQLGHLSRELIEGWKAIVAEWVKTEEELLEGGTPDSVNPSTVDEEEGLPSPPMDEGAFFATQNMELSQFFDGMDDDGNPRNCGEFNANRENRRRPPMAKQDVVPKQKEQPPRKDTIAHHEDNKGKPMRRQDAVPKPMKASNAQSGPGRPVKTNKGVPKLGDEVKSQQKAVKPTIQKRPASQAEKPRCSDDDAVQKKIEATKRRLQERYQQVENSKRQRTIQVMELHDLPKQGLQKNGNGRFGNNSRHRANVRR